MKKFDEKNVQEELNIDDLGIRDGLNASFDIDGISVSEDLIAKTLGAIKEAEGTQKAEWIEEDEGVAAWIETKEDTSANDEALKKEKAQNRRAKILRFTKIAGSIAAVLVIGVVGIKVISNSGMSMSKNDAAMESPKSFAARDEEAKVSDMCEETYSKAEYYCEDNYLADNGCEDDAYVVKNAEYTVANSADTAEEPMADAAMESDMLKSEAEVPMEPAVTEDGLTKSIEAGAAEAPASTGGVSDGFYSEDYNPIEVDKETFEAITKYLENVRADVIFDKKGFMEDSERSYLEGEILYAVKYSGNHFWDNYTLDIYKDRFYLANVPFISSNSKDYTYSMYRLYDAEATIDGIKDIISARGFGGDISE